MKQKNQPRLLWLGMLAAVLLVVLFSLSVGEYEIPFSHVLAAICQEAGLPLGKRPRCRLISWRCFGISVCRGRLWDCWSGQAWGLLEL